jgi:Arc/MetJ-type ribon-helix-helix transcriptional regulator
MTKGEPFEMNLEIHQPELERRVREGIESGRFYDVDDLLTKALDALSEKEAFSKARQGASPFDPEKASIAVARIREIRKGVRLHLDGMSIRELAHLGHKY